MKIAKRLYKKLFKKKSKVFFIRARTAKIYSQKFVYKAPINVEPLIFNDDYGFVKNTQIYLNKGWLINLKLNLREPRS